VMRIGIVQERVRKRVEGGNRTVDGCFHTHLRGLPVSAVAMGCLPGRCRHFADFAGDCHLLPSVI
jgi:hypothetical protein